ncbi:conserved exported hypothetical protein [Candidatus Sulfopaludibacter sp. SbA3]|nr:conserved exported hypothetical protein [Candidatus Sulfopaludibacter sp. SbA3]
MTAKWIFGCTILVGLNVRAQECGWKGEPLVEVHLENDMMVPAIILNQAKGIASGMFSSIGIRVEWKEGVPRPAAQPAACEARANEVLAVEFDEEVDVRFTGDAFGYAVPGEPGAAIHIFYRRVAASMPYMTAVLLGHVMAHEITHMLEGVARHSEEGVMKAHWTSQDYNQMAMHPLPFEEEDVEMVRTSLGL